MAKINLTPKKIYEQEFKTSMRGYDKKEVDVELSFEKPLPRRQDKGRRSNRGNDRRRRSDNRDKKNRNERRGTDKKFFDKKVRRMQNK